MNKDDFIKLLNIIVEKKIKQIVPKLVKEEIDNFKKELLSESKEDDTIENWDISGVIESEEDIIAESHNQVTPTVPKKRFSNNDSINAILNQTAAEMKSGRAKPIQTDTNYKQLLEQSYSDIDSEWESVGLNTTNMGAIMNHKAGRSISSAPTKDIARETLKSEVAQSGAPPEIANAMVKDYSGFLKKVNDGAQKFRRGK